MTAIDRLAKRLESREWEGRGLHERQALALARWFYDEYLPQQIIGMKGAAAMLGLASSNTLTMRLARGHDLGLAVEIDGNRITTVDAVEAYGQMHPSAPPGGDDVSQQQEAS